MASMISNKSRVSSKVVLLGASGQLGQIVRICWPNSASLIFHSRHVQPGFVSFDLCQEPDKAAFAMRGADAVVCLSGVTPAQAYKTGDPISVNVDLATAAVRAARAANVGRVFLASTAAVYGRASGVQDEDAECKPISDYGRAKLEMECEALALAQDLDQPITVLRIGNVAGADAILGGWREGMQIDQLPDGTTPRRSFIGPETLTRVIHRLSLTSNLPRIINVTAPGTVEMGALLDAANLPWSSRVAQENVIASVELSTKRLERYIHFTPQNSSAAGIVAEWRRVSARK